MADTVRIEWRGDHVAHVILNRPEKKNAMSLDMFGDLPDAAAELATKPGLRAVVMSGARGCFCAGLDLSVMQTLVGKLDQVKDRMLNPAPGEAANFYQRPVTCWQALEVPVIAAVQDVAFGAGMQLALAADFRIAAPDARLSIMEAKWGLIPDMGITQSLPKLVRADLAKELIMTARVLDAHSAADFGLLTYVDDSPLDRAFAMADEIAARSPDAIRAAKRLVEEAWALPPAEALHLEALLQSEILGAPNQLEAVAANMQGRPPKY